MWDVVLRYLSSINIPFDLIDILLVAFIIYNGILLIKETRAAQLVRGILIILVVMLLANWFRLTSISFILRNTVQVGLMAVIVVFQPELRRALEHMGRSRSILGRFGNSEADLRIVKEVNDVCEAVKLMSQYKIGALIVFERDTRLGDIINTGTVVDAAISPQLVVSLFYPNSPLHDGAMIIRDRRIHSAGCFLPLSQSNEVSKELGTRHRAALGASENSDAAIVVVSEETGKISLTKDGAMKRNLTPETLRIALMQELTGHSSAGKSKIPFWKGKKQ